MIRVFQMNDMEWWAGEGTPEEMLAAYMAETGVSREEATDDPDGLPSPLTDEEMESEMMVETDDDDQPTGRKTSFRAVLDGMIASGQKFPCLFACTEY